MGVFDPRPQPTTPKLNAMLSSQETRELRGPSHLSIYRAVGTVSR